ARHELRARTGLPRHLSRRRLRTCRRHARSGQRQSGCDRKVSWPMSTALSINAVDLHYGAAQALKSVSIVCKPGRITAVLGRNGVGKSSTLRAITGVNSISAGEIRFGDELLRKSPPYKRARMGIGYVPQGREIFPLLTVRENLETG